MNISHLFTFCVITLSFVSCGNPVKILKKEINKAGYILYQNPIEEAGSGTLIGGPPSHMMYVAYPQTCFPDDAFDGDFPMRKTDRVVLPSIAKKITTEGTPYVFIWAPRPDASFRVFLIFSIIL